MPRNSRKSTGRPKKRSSKKPKSAGRPKGSRNSSKPKSAGRPKKRSSKKPKSAGRPKGSRNSSKTKSAGRPEKNEKNKYKNMNPVVDNITWKDYLDFIVQYYFSDQSYQDDEDEEINPELKTLINDGGHELSDITIDFVKKSLNDGKLPSVLLTEFLEAMYKGNHHALEFIGDFTPVVKFLVDNGANNLFSIITNNKFDKLIQKEIDDGDGDDGYDFGDVVSKLYISAVLMKEFYPNFDWSKIPDCIEIDEDEENDTTEPRWEYYGKLLNLPSNSDRHMPIIKKIFEDKRLTKLIQESKQNIS